MPDFQGTDQITVQPGDEQVPYTFTFTVCSSATANDGAIPFGTTVDSVVVSATMADGTADAELVDSSSESANVVTVKLTYPSTNGNGRYHLKFLITLDNVDASVIEFDFNRVVVEDK